MGDKEKASCLGCLFILCAALFCWALVIGGALAIIAALKS